MILTVNIRSPVCLVHLVRFVQPKNQTNQTDEMNKTGWEDFSVFCCRRLCGIRKERRRIRWNERE